MQIYEYSKRQNWAIWALIHTSYPHFHIFVDKFLAKFNFIFKKPQKSVDFWNMNFRRILTGRNFFKKFSTHAQIKPKFLCEFCIFIRFDFFCLNKNFHPHSHPFAQDVAHTQNWSAFWFLTIKWLAKRQNAYFVFFKKWLAGLSETKNSLCKARVEAT